MNKLLFCVSAELKEAVRTWPHTDPVSWAQRTTAVALVRRLDQSLEKADAALRQNDPKYYRGETYRLHFPEACRYAADSNYYREYTLFIFGCFSITAEVQGRLTFIYVTGCTGRFPT